MHPCLTVYCWNWPSSCYHSHFPQPCFNSNWLTFFLTTFSFLLHADCIIPMEVNVVMSQLLILHSLCGKILQNFITCCFIYACGPGSVEGSGGGGSIQKVIPGKVHLLSVWPLDAACSWMQVIVNTFCESGCSAWQPLPLLIAYHWPGSVP